MTNQQGAPEALVLATLLDMAPETGIEPQTAEDASSELRRLHAENERLAALVEAQQPAPTPQADTQPADYQPLPSTYYLVAGEIRGWDEHQMRAYVDSARAARAPADSVTAPAGGANWQDISTAPKDGTRFVAVGQNYGLDSETQHTCIAQWLAGCWIEVSDWNGASKLKYLTHWMPLPPLPGSAARAPADSVTAPAAGAVAGPGFVQCSYGDGGYACCEGGPCQADLHNEQIAAAPTQPAQGAGSVLEDAALLHYALSDGGNQSMNWQDIFDDWNGEGHFIDALRVARKQGEKQ